MKGQKCSSGSFFLVCTLLVGGCAVTGDYGDAPDGSATGYPIQFAQVGQFPTLSASGGAVAQQTGQATLGPAASAELDANDPADPDGVPNLNPSNNDSDDGVVGLTVVLTSIPPPAVMSVSVAGAPGTAAGTFFVNVVIDMNLDGQWGGTLTPGVTEWAVRNFPVVVTPGVTTPVTLPPFLFANGNRLPDGAWMRIRLSDDPIASADWDGSGAFGAGEVEDHVISLPRKRAVMVMTCPPRVLFPAGAPNGAQQPFGCFIANTGTQAGTARYRMDRVTPGVEVQDLNLAIPCAQRGPGARIRCGVTPAIPPLLPLGFRATKTGDLPSRWTYRASVADPPSVVTPSGVTIGFGDSTGDVDFESVPEDVLEAFVSPGDGQVLISFDGPLGRETIIVYPGGGFAGIPYEELLERGRGPIQLRQAQ